MVPGAEGLRFGPKNLEQTILNYVHFIENCQGKVRQHYLQVQIFPIFYSTKGSQKKKV